MRLGLRRRLLLSVLGAVALVLVVLGVLFNLVLHNRLNHEANNELIARASAELASLDTRGDRITARELPDAAALDARTWIFAGSKLLEQPRSDPTTSRAAQSLSRGTRRTQDVPATHTRLYAVPVVSGGQRLGTVVAELSLRPFEDTEQTAFIASLVLALVVLAVVALASRVVISAALGPVATMTAQAAEWSEADTGLRFDLGQPHDEITRLAATLDELLDRVASSLQHEQRFSAELSHELRTPLASIVAEAQYALRHAKSTDQHRAGFDRVLLSAEQMTRTLDTLLAVARADIRGARAWGDPAEAARAATRGYSWLAEGRGVAIDVVDTSVGARMGVETEVAERILAPLVENGVRHGRARVAVRIEPGERFLTFVVEDDGPGVADADHERIFDPGWRGRSSSGAGLGLPLARRLARAVGGDVTVENGGPGARFKAQLPAR